MSAAGSSSLCVLCSKERSKLTSLDGNGDSMRDATLYELVERREVASITPTKSLPSDQVISNLSRLTARRAAMG